MKGLIVGATLLLVLSCNRSVNSGGSIDSDCRKNETGQFELCISKSELNKDGSSLIVYKLINIDGEVLLTDSMESGYVKWLDENSLEIYRTPGNVSTEIDKNDIIRVYNIVTKEFISKKEYLSSRI